MWVHWVLGVATLLVILLSVVVGCLAISLQNKYTACAESNLTTGRAEYLDHLQKQGAVIGQGSKTITTTSGDLDEVVKYHSEKSVRDILNIHKQAKHKGIDGFLAKIHAHGNNFIIYEQCHAVTPDTLPPTWRKDMAEIDKLRTIGLQDFYHGNIMVCGNGSESRLKLTDQDPSVELEAVGYAFRDQFNQTMDRFSSFERECERRAGDKVAQEK